MADIVDLCIYYKSGDYLQKVPCVSLPESFLPVDLPKVLES